MKNPTFIAELHKKLGRLGAAEFMIAGKLTGLGRQLSVTVRLVESETGGQIWAEASPVGGARFVIQLPLAMDATVPDPRWDALRNLDLFDGTN